MVAVGLRFRWESMVGARPATLGGAGDNWGCGPFSSSARERAGRDKRVRGSLCFHVGTHKRGGCYGGGGDRGDDYKSELHVGARESILRCAIQIFNLMIETHTHANARACVITFYYNTHSHTDERKASSN